MSYPKRIISLVPSQTELLFDLGLDEEVVGITRFCIHPKAHYKRKPKVGGTKNFRFDVIEKLQPDLILGNKEENYKEGIEQLQATYPVWISDIQTLEEAYAMISKVSALVGKQEAGKKLLFRIQSEFEKLAQIVSSQPKTQAKKRVLYLIWRKPYMVAAANTFIHAMLEIAGFQNAAQDQKRYPQLTDNQIIDYNPDEIWLSSEPYRFSEKHLAEFEALCPHASVKIVDGELFSWYGSRLQYAPHYIREHLL